jgi:hypothetical protein
MGNPFTAIRDGIAGLNLGKGVLGGTGTGSEKSGDARSAMPTAEQELKSMD